MCGVPDALLVVIHYAPIFIPIIRLILCSLNLALSKIKKLRNKVLVAFI